MKKYLIITTTCLLLGGSMNAQVTIGSREKPNAGALLDIKTEPDGSSKLGLGLPRVELTNLTPTTNAELAKSIGNATGSYDMADHAGMIVYNVKKPLNLTTCEVTGVPIGLYIWSGTEWTDLGSIPVELSDAVYTFTDSRDGEVYSARNFGSVAGDWMLENVRYVPTAADFTHTAASSITDKYYAYPEKDESPYVPANHPSAQWASKKKNGLLYNWSAATNGQNGSTESQGQGQTAVTPIQGICPANWHLPSDKEWNDLEREIYNNAHLYSNYTEAEKNTWTPWNPNWETLTSGLRPTSAPADAHGKAMLSPCPPVGNSSATNGRSLVVQQGGFNLVPSGRIVNGNMVNYGVGIGLWSNSSYNTTNAWSRYISRSNSGVSKDSRNREVMHSVRCKKD